MARGQKLNSYLQSGVRADHESYSADEMLEKLRNGMHVVIRESSISHFLTENLRIVTEMGIKATRRISFCTDDVVASDILARGHLDNMVRMAVRMGIPPLTAIQMAKAAGARVIATARGPKKADQARRVGADLAIDTTGADWAGEARSAGGADVVLDMVGADFFAANVELLKADGRLVVIATMSGHKVEVDLRFLMTKRLTVTASTLRARDADEKARLARAVEERVWPWVEAGRVRPIVDRTFPLEDAAEAHRWLELGAQFGKVVLTFDER